MSGPVLRRDASSRLALPVILLVGWYQRWVSPLLPSSCRFYPSCSQYAIEALAAHGLVRGVALTFWRLLRCAPWHSGGVDPVPPRRNHPHCPDVGRDEGRADRGVDGTALARDREDGRTKIHAAHATEERRAC